MYTIRKILFFTFLSLVFVLNSDAQSDIKTDDVEIGLEVQVYPTGIIPGLRIERFLSEKSSWNVRLAYQFINHRDLGVQENEKGSGFGGSIAYRRFFNTNQKGFSLAFRSDIWLNTIDWTTGNDSGTTTLTILQPTLMGEYVFQVSPSIYITPSLCFGWEWNVVTDGEPTGEGAILLVGCNFGFRF